MTMQITFSQVQAAQRVVAGGIEEMNALTRRVLAQAGSSQAAMQAPAGRISAGTYDQLGGAGRALAETLRQLHDDLGRLQAAAHEGSDAASRAASGAVAAGMGV